MSKTQIISLQDGFIEIHPNGLISWCGVLANDIRYIYHNALRKQGIEDSQAALIEFINRVVIK